MCLGYIILQLTNCWHRLLELAPTYFNLNEFKDSEMKRALLRVQNKRLNKRMDGPGDEGRKSKKQRK